MEGKEDIEPLLMCQIRWKCIYEIFAANYEFYKLIYFTNYRPEKKTCKNMVLYWQQITEGPIKPVLQTFKTPSSVLIAHVIFRKKRIDTY